jgi:E3 ubiquitin-protein ligase UBR4
MISVSNWLHFMLPHNLSTTDSQLKDLLVAMLFDVRTEFMYDSAVKCLKTLTGSELTSENFQIPAYLHLIQHTYTILIEFCELNPSNIDESALHSVIAFWDSLLEKPNGLKALREFFYERKSGNLVNVLLSFGGTSQKYSHKVLKFFEKLFQVSENMDSSFPIDEVCGSLGDLGTIEPTRLRNWLSHILLGSNGLSNNGSPVSSDVPTPTNISSLPIDKKEEAMEVDDDVSRHLNLTPVDDTHETNGKLLQSLTKFLVTETKMAPNVSQALFQAMLQLSNNLLTSDAVMCDFSVLFHAMVTLADADQGRGHAMLFSSALGWLESANNCSKFTKNDGKHQMENLTSLLNYLSDLLGALNGQPRPVSSVFEDEMSFDIEEIIANERESGENEDAENVAEDSDEDTNKLCTFTITQKDFMNQHWYW